MRSRLLWVSPSLLRQCLLQESFADVTFHVQGPTLTMRVHEYALMRDIAAAQPRPRAPASLWSAPPLLVMNNFGEKKL